MRIEITGQWKDGFEHDGILYCAQRIEEMLMHYTSHLYKVPVYNSFLLCAEYLRIYDLVKESKIDHSHLSNTLEEFINTFSNDIVIREHFSGSEIQSFVSRLKGSSEPEKRKTMYYIMHRISAYPQWSAETLRKAVSSKTEKKKIERALRSYLPMLIGMGYQPFHIYRYCKQVFMNPEICDEQCIDLFIDHFNGSDIEYVVYFAVDKKVEKFRSILKSRLNISFDQDDYSKRLKFDRDKYICINMQASALDPNGAAIRAYDAFNIFMRYYKFLGNRDEEWCFDKALVKTVDGTIEFPRFIPDSYYFSKDYDDKTLGSNSERTITKLLENAAGNDFWVIDKIVTTHNTALQSHDAYNAFLNLWSVIEIVGVYDHTDSKIKEILRSIVPVLKRNYIKCVVEELHDYLKANMNGDEYKELLDSLHLYGSEEFKIACLVMLPQHQDKRQVLYQNLKQYPLIRSRISQLYEDIFKHKKDYSVELDRYGQRLIWHIQRLYRVRNSISHSGEPDENINTLVEHLHSYVDEVVLEIIKRLTQENSLGSISNVLMDSQVFLGNMEKDLRKKEPFTIEDIKKMIN